MSDLPRFFDLPTSKQQGAAPMWALRLDCLRNL